MCVCVCVTVTMQGRAGKAGKVLLSLKRNCSRFIELQRLAIGDKVQRFNGDWRHKQTHKHKHTHCQRDSKLHEACELCSNCKD